MMEWTYLLRVMKMFHLKNRLYKIKTRKEENSKWTMILVVGLPEIILNVQMVELS
jgi:hypothetical protein